eukprot:34879_1
MTEYASTDLRLQKTKLPERVTLLISGYLSNECNITLPKSVYYLLGIYYFDPRFAMQQIKSLNSKNSLHLRSHMSSQSLNFNKPIHSYRQMLSMVVNNFNNVKEMDKINMAMPPSTPDLQNKNRTQRIEKLRQLKQKRMIKKSLETIQ